MAIATITKTVLSGTLTTLIIANGIRDALINAGYTLFHSYTSGSNEVRVMALQQSNATKGTIFLQVTVNSGGSIIYSLHETWTPGTNTGTGTNSTTATTITTGNGTTALTIYAIAHPEFKGLSLEQGTAQGILGVMRPLKNNLIPSWWNENLFPYAFLPRASTVPANSRFGSCNTPYGANIDHEYLNNAKLQDGNAQDNDRRSTLPFIVWQNGNYGVLCVSDDIITCASNTMRLMDTVTVSANEVYTYFWINNTHSGLAIRTV
jgi:hypothetical protein